MPQKSVCQRTCTDKSRDTTQKSTTCHSEYYRVSLSMGRRFIFGNSAIRVRARMRSHLLSDLTIPQI